MSTATMIRQAGGEDGPHPGRGDTDARERTHHYHYDSQHRLVFYTRISMASHWSRAATSTTRWDGECETGMAAGA